MRDTWSKMAKWELVLPPSRPDQWQLDAIRARSRGINKTMPVAVLGSTREFRDLLKELGFVNIYVFERNLGFYRQVSETRIYKNKETLVAGDWALTLPGFTDHFALILSDLTSGNVPYDTRNHFYESLSRSLCANGILIDKVLTHPIPHISLKELEARYSEETLNLQSVNRFSCEALFCSELLSNEIVQSSLFYAELRRRLKHPRVRAFISASSCVTPRGCKWWYGRPWERIRRSHLSHFRVLKVEDDIEGSPYFRRVKLFYLTKC